MKSYQKIIMKIEASKVEKELESSVKAALTVKGCLCYKFVSPARVGVPDAIIIKPDGDVFFIEFKSPSGSGTLSPNQQIEIGKIRRQNCPAYIVGNASDFYALVMQEFGDEN